MMSNNCGLNGHQVYIVDAFGVSLTEIKKYRWPSYVKALFFYNQI